MVGGLVAVALLIFANWIVATFNLAVVGPHDLYGVFFWVSLVAALIGWRMYWNRVKERPGWRDYPRRRSTAEIQASRAQWEANQWIRDWESNHTPSRRNLRTKYARDYVHWTKIAYRDGRNCHICMKPVDPNDFTRNKGRLQAGPNYPSVDHVIPKSKGGSHGLWNLKLAHHRCNMLKRTS